MEKSIDCVVCGSCVVDIIVRPVPLNKPLGTGQMVRTEPLMLTTGGMVSNAGITLAKLGMHSTAFTYVGNDAWAEVVRSRYQAEGVDTSQLQTHQEMPTSTTAVIINEAGQRSFLHAVGAPKAIDKKFFLDHLDLFARSRFMLLGYYPLLPNLLDDLPEILAAIRGTGCQTALDAAGGGGTMEPLSQCLPHLDYYLPSIVEAQHQTGETDPLKIISTYRQSGAQGLLGIKLGSEGALLSPQPGKIIELPAITPPGKVVDTTGAGDCFFGGLLAGILRHMTPRGCWSTCHRDRSPLRHRFRGHNCIKRF